jgi:hypothetical protein
MTYKPRIRMTVVLMCCFFGRRKIKYMRKLKNEMWYINDTGSKYLLRMSRQGIRLYIIDRQEGGEKVLPQSKMVAAILACIEISILLFGVLNYTGAHANTDRINRLWDVMDGVTVVLSFAIACCLCKTAAPLSKAIAMVLAVVAVAIVVLHFDGARPVAPIWKYIDGMNLGLLLSIILSESFSVTEGLGGVHGMSADRVGVATIDHAMLPSDAQQSKERKKKERPVSPFSGGQIGATLEYLYNDEGSN